MSDNIDSGYADARREWDAAAERFDDEPDHGLRDPKVLLAWVKLLAAWLPGPSGRALDVGCGTGALSAVLVALGHRVVGIDFSPRMLASAQAKAAWLSPRPSFCLMDASRPGFAPQSFEVILCRHVLWALPEREQALSRWANLLRPGGRLLLIEGFWSTGSGMTARDLVAQLPAALTLAAVLSLSGEPELWGKEVADERYAVVAARR